MLQVISTVSVTALVCLLWVFMKPILLALGQEEDIASGAARYLLLGIPSLVAAGLLECLKRYLMVQGVVQPVTAVSAITLVLSPLYNWLLIFKSGWGIDGAVAAIGTSYFSMLIMLWGYVLWHDRRRRGQPEQTWHGWSRDCLKGLGAYNKLAVPAALMVCLEWWAYEFAVIISGWLPDPQVQLAAIGVMMQISTLCFMFSLGLSCATSVLVGNALGANLPHAARRNAAAATGITVVTQTVLALIVVVSRGSLATVFTNSSAVVAACGAAFSLMAVNMFGDGLNCTIGGVLRGAGRQLLGALLNLGSFWGLGVPLAYALAVQAHLQLKGLWIGFIVATSVQATAMLIVLARLNWPREAQRAAELQASSGCDAAQHGDAGGVQDAEQGDAAGAASVCEVVCKDRAEQMQTANSFDSVEKGSSCKLDCVSSAELILSTEVGSGDSQKGRSGGPDVERQT